MPSAQAVVKGGGALGPTAGAAAPRRPSASCDAPPRKDARASRHRIAATGLGAAGAGHRPPGCRPRSLDEVLEAGPSPPAQRHAHSRHTARHPAAAATPATTPHTVAHIVMGGTSGRHTHGEVRHPWRVGRPRRGGGRRLGREPGDRLDRPRSCCQCVATRYQHVRSTDRPGSGGDRGLRAADGALDTCQRRFRRTPGP